MSFLNDRALFTFGAYGGQSQNLVDDLRIGDELPDRLGDAKLYRKSLTWKPGFSFSYSFPRSTKRAAVSPSGAASAPADDDLRNDKFRVLRQIHLTHTARAELALNFVMTQASAVGKVWAHA